MSDGDPRRPPGDRLIRSGYWIVPAVLALGAARTLARLPGSDGRG